MAAFDRRGEQPTESWHGEPAPTATSSITPPEVPPRYELGPELGRGGMAVVYAAHDRQLDRRVALKVLQPHRRGDELQQRLVREAQALARLRHPAVVTVYDVTMHADRVLVAMELVEGATLRDWASASDRTMPQRLAACIAAGRGLAAVHDAGLVHRDFKPDNVLVGTDGQVRVADFGLARLARVDSHEEADFEPVNKPARAMGTITQAGSLVGTLPYMPLEVLQGEPADARSDQYAFAVTLVEVLGGKRPYHADSHQGYLEATAAEPVLGDAIPKWIRTIAVRGLASDPDQRFPTMNAMLEALGRDPARRRKQVALALGAAVVIAGAGFAIHAATRTEAASCELPVAYAAAWSSERATAVRGALETGAVDPVARASAIASLDAYHRQLGDAHAAACRERESQGPDIAILRAACLERRTAELDALTEQLSRADAKQAGRAVAAAQNLAAIADCASVAMIAGAVPRKPEVAEEGRVIDIAIARAKTQIGLGQQAEAKAALEPLIPRVQRMEHGPTEAELLIQLGAALEGLDEVPAAEQAFRRAIVLAQTGRADELVARAATQLALDLARIQRKPDDGRPWVDLAMATLARMPPTPWLESRVTFALAIVELAQSRMADAEQHATRAYDLCKRANGEASLACAEMLNTLGGVALKSNQLELAFQRYDAARATTERSVGRDHPSLFAIQANLGSVAYARGDFARSAEIRADLATRAARVLGPKHARVADVYLRLGVTLEQLGKLPEAIAATRTALEIFTASRGPDFPGTISAKLQLAYELVRSGDRTAIGFPRELIASKRAAPGDVVTALEVELALALAEHRAVDARKTAEIAIAIATAGKLERNESLARIVLALAVLQREAGDPAAPATAQRAVVLAEEIFAPAAAPVVAARAERARAASPSR